MIEPLLAASSPIGGRNTHALMTTQGSQQLTGILLPSLRAFTINLSKQMAGRAWMAASPGLPPVKN